MTYVTIIEQSISLSTLDIFVTAYELAFLGFVFLRRTMLFSLLLCAVLRIHLAVASQLPIFLFRHRNLLSL